MVAAVFGLVLGSFLNVVILRFDDWLSIIKTRSRCPDCKTQLKWYDLFPLVSYLTLKGKCRYCQKPICWQYPVVELTAAVLLAMSYNLVFLEHSLPLWQGVTAFAFLVLAVACAIVIFFHDLYEQLIPDSMSYVLLAAALGFNWFFFQDWQSVVYGALIGVAPIALLVYPSRGKWMGEGDVKLAAALGLLVGYPAAIVFLVVAFLIGGLVGAVIVASGKATVKTAVPFAPFLILGALTALFYGQALVDWYLGKLGL